VLLVFIFTEIVKIGRLSNLGREESGFYVI